MLLLKKKKYAAVKIQFKDGIAYEVFCDGFFSVGYPTGKFSGWLLCCYRLLNAKAWIWCVVTGAYYQRNWEISA